MEGSLAGAIVWAAMAGGGAWVVFSIIPETWRAARMPVAIVCAIMGALNGLSRPDPTEAPYVSRVERELLESEQVGDLARAFKDADPLGFAAYVEQVRLALERDAESNAMMEAGYMIGAAAEARLARGPIENIVTYYALQRDEYRAMASASPLLCRRLFFGEDVSESELPNLPAIQRRRLALYQRAFESPQNEAPEPLPEQELRGALAAIHEEVAALAGPDAELLLQDKDATGREARACEVIALYFDQLSLSPDAPRILATFSQPPGTPT